MAIEPIPARQHYIGVNHMRGSDESLRGSFALLLPLAFIVLSHTINGEPAAPPQGMISVDGARPLANAIEILEQRYHRMITYEDPLYLYAADLKDVSDNVRRDGTIGKPKVLVPRGGALAILDASPPGSVMPTALAALERVVVDYNASGLAGGFKVMQDGAGGCPVRC